MELTDELKDKLLLLGSPHYLTLSKVMEIRRQHDEG